MGVFTKSSKKDTCMCLSFTIHSFPTEGHWKFQGRKQTNLLEEKLNWNFLGVSRCKTKTFCGECIFSGMTQFGFHKFWLVFFPLTLGGKGGGGGGNRTKEENVSNAFQPGKKPTS